MTALASEPRVAAADAPRPAAPQRPIVTRAEQAECTCPEACERDHERD